MAGPGLDKEKPDRRGTPGGGKSSATRPTINEAAKLLAGAAYGSMPGSSRAEEIYYELLVPEQRCLMVQESSDGWEDRASILIVACALLLWTVLCICLGCWCQREWYGRTRKALAGSRQGRNVQTQCNRPTLDLKEINKLTIQAIRIESEEFRGGTQGNKAELAGRLLWFRSRRRKLRSILAALARKRRVHLAKTCWR